MKTKKRILTQITGAFLTVIIFAANAPFVSLAAKNTPSPSDIISQDFPVLEITLDGYEEDGILRDDWQGMSCRLTADGKVLESTAKIKGRGNYTWAQAKRPYAIKLDAKQDWFGFGAAKDWVLLANYTDETHLRNFYAFTLAAGFNFAFTPQVRHAQVFINGSYAGLYLITEKIEIDSKRVNINIANGDLLLELDNNYGSGEPEVFSSRFDNLFVVKDPDGEAEFNEKTAEKGTDITFSRAKRFAKTQLNAFESGLEHGVSLDKLNEYIDIASLVDWYIFNEIMKNDDSVFTSSMYLNSRYGDKLYMGPVWDYDISLAGISRFNNRDSSGFIFLENPWSRSGNWFLYLAVRDDFNDLVKARWRELYSSSLFRDSMEELKRVQVLLRTQQPYDEAVWNNGGVFVKMSDYNEAVGYLRHFITSRISWLNSVWGDAAVTPGPATTPEPPATDTPIPTETPAITEPAAETATPDPAKETPEDGSGASSARGCGGAAAGPLFIALPAAVALAVRAKKRRR